MITITRISARMNFLIRSPWEGNDRIAMAKEIEVLTPGGCSTTDIGASYQPASKERLEAEHVTAGL